MAHRTRDFSRLEELAHKLRVLGVARQVNDGPVSADVEDGIVVRDLDVCQLLRAGQLGFDGLVLEELDGFVVFEAL